MNYSVETARTKNGYSILCCYNSNCPICEVQLIIRNGSQCDPVGKEGTAHFLEHMLFQGTATKDSKTITRDLNAIGSFNAYTSQQSTAMHFDCQNEQFKAGLKLLKESVFDSTCPEAEIAKERDVILEELEAYYCVPQSAFVDFIALQAFGPELGHCILGSAESVSNTTRDDLLDFHKTWYTSRNMTLLVVGGIPIIQAIEAVEEYFPTVTGDTVLTTDTVQVKPNTAIQTFRSGSREQGELAVVFPWPSFLSKSATKVHSSVLILALHEYLFEHLRNEMGLCYSTSHEVLDDRGSAYMILSLPALHRNLKKLHSEILNELEKIRTDSFPPMLLENAKNKAAYQYMCGMLTPQGISAPISDAITICESVDVVAGCVTHLVDIPFVRQTVAQITMDDIVEMASTYLEPLAFFQMIK